MINMNMPTPNFSTFLSIFIFAWSNLAHAAFTNYNSIMLGDRAGGMGGAFTALSDDPAASAYYNPATLARLEGSSLSASINLFNKYDVAYGGQEKLDEAVFRINKGSILSIPSASGVFSSFRNFTAGLSIVIPDYQSFGGDIVSSGDNSTFLRLNDQSIWIGGAFAFNIDEQQAIGFTTYYTSRTFSRSLNNRYDTGTEIVAESEEKTLSTNSIVYILGYFRALSDQWSVGASYRLPSLHVTGEGAYLQSQVGTVSGALPIVKDSRLKSKTKIPSQLNLGVAYSVPRKVTYSFDLRLHGSNSNMDLDSYGDRIENETLWNASLGYEKYLEPWLAMRLGLFTDFSSSPDIPYNPTRRYSDQIDKFGFSANLGIHTTKHTILTLGGYYLGGSGWSTEKIGSGFQKIKKSDRLFSFLVGSSYSF